jgi:hypothetical protein
LLVRRDTLRREGMSVALARCIARGTAHADDISALDRTGAVAATGLGGVIQPDEKSYWPKWRVTSLNVLAGSQAFVERACFGSR